MQNYLEFHSLIVVSKIVKNQKHQRKIRIFGVHRMISVLYDFFYNSPNSHNLMQIKIYRYQKSKLKKKQKLFLPLAFSKSGESIISGIYMFFFYFFLTLVPFVIYKSWVGNIINFIIFKKVSV